MDDAVLVVAVCLLSASQVLQKLGAQRSLEGARSLRTWLAALFSPLLLSAAVCLAAGFALWLYVLYRMDVTRAYPFLSFGMIVVVAISRLYLKERVAPLRWAGVVLIAIGIALVAQT